MTNLMASQGNDCDYIQTAIETQESLLPKVNDEVQAIREGEKAIREGRTMPANKVFENLKVKHGF